MSLYREAWDKLYRKLGDSDSPDFRFTPSGIRVMMEMTLEEVKQEAEKYRLKILKELSE